ncbi:hypothetical protein D3C80_564240 [compost metagenome]
MLAIARHQHIQTIDEVTGMGHLQLDQQVFQANGRVETAHLVQRFAADHQGRRRRIGLALEEHVVEIQTTERHIPTLALLGVEIAVGIDQFDVTGANADLGLALHMRDLSGDSLRQHDVIRTERHDQAALGPGNCTVEGVGQPLVFLNPEVEAMDGLQCLDPLDAVILRAVVDHQQLDVPIGLVEDAENAFLDVRGMVVRRDDDRDDGLRVVHGCSLRACSRPESIRLRYSRRNSSMSWCCCR